MTATTDDITLDCDTCHRPITGTLGFVRVDLAAALGRTPTGLDAQGR